MTRPQEYLDVVEAIAEEAVAQRKEDRERYISESVSGSEWTFNANRLRERYGDPTPSRTEDGWSIAFLDMRNDIQKRVAVMLYDKFSFFEEHIEEVASHLTDIDKAIELYAEEDDGEIPDITFYTSMIRSILGIKEED